MLQRWYPLKSGRSTSHCAGVRTPDLTIALSKGSLDVCLLSDQTKSGQRYRKFKNDKGAHSDLNSWLLKTAKCKAEDILITLESTGIYHESIAFCLHMAGFLVHISNPGKAKKFSQSLGLVHKTDKSDSYMLHREAALICGHQIV
ncbi:transposase [Photobacterium sp. 1_MG-2023]|uniref:IS110 family transposase n=1 Tax=Photobacterium sp. 1_MG-2023 TaxID=3062646 RepID=UPI0034C62BBA